MECSVCHVRSTVGYCKTCERMLCEVCGISCSRCKKLVCREHRSTTPGGRNLCPECMAAREAKRKAQEAEKAGAAMEGSGLSFQELMADVGDELAADHPVEAPPEPEEEKLEDWRPDWAGEAPPEPAPKEEKPKSLEEELNARVLTASTPPPRPMWIGALAAPAMAWLLVFLLWNTTMFRDILQPWMSYLIMLMAAGGLLWAGAGGLRPKAGKAERVLCGTGFLLSFVALVVAWRMRHG